MRLIQLGLSDPVEKSTFPATPTGFTSWRNLWFTIAESFAGAWQTGEELTLENILTHPTVYACVTLIASDIAKMRLMLVQFDDDGLWTEYENSSFSPVLRKPNHYQNRIQFVENWQLSRLIHGNTYVLKARDNRQVVQAMYVLDPNRVAPKITPDGELLYQVNADNLAGVEQDMAVPASEIIHDRINPIYHPLMGISPIHAAWLASKQGLSIQKNSQKFHENGAAPGGLLMVPGHLSPDQAARLKEAWSTNYGGDNVGTLAVLADGMKYEPMKVMSAQDNQAVEQLKWGDEKICSVFKVPAYMVGVGQIPSNQNVEALGQQYYSQCLQSPIEHMESSLDHGLGLMVGKIEGRKLRVMCQIEDLLRMDTATKMTTAAEGVRGGVFAPNEARRKFNLGPRKGGDTIYLQHQDYSIEALAERDANKPFAKPTPAAPSTPAVEPNEEQPEPDEERMVALLRVKAAEMGLAA